MRHMYEGYQTRSLFSSDHATITPAPKAHKLANSDVPVGKGARRCSFREVNPEPFKQSPPFAAHRDDPVLRCNKMLCWIDESSCEFLGLGLGIAMYSVAAPALPTSLRIGLIFRVCIPEK